MHPTQISNSQVPTGRQREVCATMYPSRQAERRVGTVDDGREA